MRPGFNLVVSLDGDKLMLAQPGQPMAQLVAASATTFYVGIQDMEVEFVKTGLVAHLGDQTFNATRQ